MRCSDLRGGDILLQFNAGTVVGSLISFGQRMQGQSHSSIVHAGILFDNHYMIQALGPGISGTDVRVQDARLGYFVYRSKQANLAAGAATCAKMMFDVHGAHQTLKYSVSGAVGSLFGKGPVKTRTQMNALLDDILTGKGHPFFCSQFVVYVYQFVAEQNGLNGSLLFNLGDAKVSPAKLATVLEKNSFFSAVGYLNPSER